MKSTTIKAEQLQDYGFTPTPIVYYAEFTDVRKQPPELIWPDFVYRGDEIVSITGQYIPAGETARLVGMFGEQLTIHCEQDIQTYKEICAEFDQLPSAMH